MERKAGALPLVTPDTNEPDQVDRLQRSHLRLCGALGGTRTPDFLIRSFVRGQSSVVRGHQKTHVFQVFLLCRTHETSSMISGIPHPSSPLTARIFEVPDRYLRKSPNYGGAANATKETT